MQSIGERRQPGRADGRRWLYATDGLHGKSRVAQRLVVVPETGGKHER